MTTSSPSSETVLLDEQEVGTRIRGLAESILAAYPEEIPALVGIYTRGVTLARRIAAILEEEKGGEIDLGVLDVSLYRDDLDALKGTPALKQTSIDFDIEGREVLLCDEVVYTGRTTRAALNELLDFGRPAHVKLAVLVDRAGRELPLQPDFSAYEVETRGEQYVKVRFHEDDGREGVFLKG